MPWKYLHASAKGSCHEECQDYHRIGIVNNSLVAIVCDGAGSAKYSLRGAKKAADTLFDALQVCTELPDETQVKTMIQAAKEGLLEEAVNEPLSAFATTLLGAVLREEGSLFQIGDGAIITWEEGTGTVVFWPKSYEYANQTAFLTDDFPDLQVRYAPACLEAAFFTDGLQALGLEYATKSVYENFFAPFRECLALAEPERIESPGRGVFRLSGGESKDA